MERRERLFEEVQLARVRVAALNDRAAGDVAGAAPEALGELWGAFEELRVAEEELTRQARELGSLARTVEGERRRYESLFESLPDGCLVTDRDGKIQEINGAGCAMLGAQRSFFEGRPLVLHAKEAERRDWRNRILALGESRGKPQQWRTSILAHGGREVPVRVDAAPMKTGCLGAVGIRWIIRDDSAEVEWREHARQEREQSERQLEERTRGLANRARSLERSLRDAESFSQAARGLSEPLRAIAEQAGALAGGLGAEAGARAAELAGQARRLSAQLDGMVAYARAAGAPGAAPVDLSEVVARSVAGIGPLLDGVRVEVETPLPTVWCDPDGVSVLLTNLISNAALFNTSQEKWVRIGAVEGPEGPVVYVKDNGIGIAPDRQEAVFELFRRLHGRDTFGGGVGAGLAVAKRIVEAHGGRIWVDSAAGHGAAFYFTLRPAPSGNA